MHLGNDPIAQLYVVANFTSVCFVIQKTNLVLTNLEVTETPTHITSLKSRSSIVFSFKSSNNNNSISQ